MGATSIKLVLRLSFFLYIFSCGINLCGSRVHTKSEGELGGEKGLAGGCGRRKTVVLYGGPMFGGKKG